MPIYQKDQLLAELADLMQAAQAKVDTLHKVFGDTLTRREKYALRDVSDAVVVTKKIAGR